MPLDWITVFSDWVDRNVFTIRSIISGTLVVGTIGVLMRTKYGQRLKSTSPLLQEVAQHKGQIFGKYIVQDSKVFFYHEPFWHRFILGRTKEPVISDCLCIQMNHQEKLKKEYLEEFVSHRVGLLQIEKVEDGIVYGTPKIKLKWYHLWRSNMDKHASRWLLAQKNSSQAWWKKVWF